MNRILGVFFLTAALSACLLFMVQPMATMALMPLFGGGAYVWNAAQVFFQLMVLLGYGYAYGLSKLRPVRRQLAVHGAVGVATLVFLPLGLSAGDTSGLADAPVQHIITMLLKDAGAPFFMLAATASLLQHWLSRGFGVEEPYGLYRASNAGSFAGLLSYPLLVQPQMALGQQMVLWSAAFVAFLVLLAWCARLFLKGLAIPAHGQAVADESERKAAATLRPLDRLWWVLLSFGPVSLLMATNTHITTDVPSFPLIWVVPLALYLLSFVFGFAVWHRYALWGVLIVQALAVMGVLVCSTVNARVALGHYYVLLVIGACFLTALACHQELYRRRPPKEALTEYYLLISLGGFLAGVFNVLAVPVVFPVPVELPVMLLLCVLMRTDLMPLHSLRRVALYVIVPFMVFVGCVAVSTIDPRTTMQTLAPWGLKALAAGSVAAVLLYSQTRLALFLILAGFYLNAEGRQVWKNPFGELVYYHRNFYGIARVFDVPAPLNYRALHHGTTLHGVQSRYDEYKMEPSTYYFRATPIADAIYFRQQKSDAIRVGLIGVGTGTLQCYARPADHFRFFEIDRDMAALAENREIFTYLSDCPGSHDIVIGDGRLSLVKEPDETFDVIVADAFSSDSIPIHLLTREAVSMYLSKLKPDGVLAIHISNRYMNLAHVVAGIAADLNVPAFTRKVMISNYDPMKALQRRATWILLTKNEDIIQELAYYSDRQWQDIRYTETRVLWRDDYASLLNVIRW